MFQIPNKSAAASNMATLLLNYRNQFKSVRLVSHLCSYNTSEVRSAVSNFFSLRKHNKAIITTTVTMVVYPFVLILIFFQREKKQKQIHVLIINVVRCRRFVVQTTKLCFSFWGLVYIRLYLSILNWLLLLLFFR